MQSYNKKVLKCFMIQTQIIDSDRKTLKGLNSWDNSSAFQGYWFHVAFSCVGRHISMLPPLRFPFNVPLMSVFKIVCMLRDVDLNMLGTLV